MCQIRLEIWDYVNKIWHWEWFCCGYRHCKYIFVFLFLCCSWYNINKFHLNCKNAPHYISFAGIRTIFISPVVCFRPFLIVKRSKWLVVIPHCWVGPVTCLVFTFGQAPFPPLIKVGLELIGFMSWIHVPARLKDWLAAELIKWLSQIISHHIALSSGLELHRPFVPLQR